MKSEYFGHFFSDMCNHPDDGPTRGVALFETTRRVWRIGSERFCSHPSPGRGTFAGHLVGMPGSEAQHRPPGD
jgi:hypothetical protein